MEENNNSFRWYDFDVYGEKEEPTNVEIAKNLKSTYAALFKIMGEINGVDMPLEEIVDYAKCAGRKGEAGTLKDILTKEKFGNVGRFDESKKDSDDVKKEKEKNRLEISNNAKKILERLVENKEITAVQKEIIKAYFQAFESYGTGARDNVLTSATILTTKGVNARIGCGQGKTDISKAWAMAKHAEEKRSVITTSTPELAAQSFKESFKGMNQAGLKVAYISGTQIMYAKGEKDDDGKFVSITKDLSELSDEKIKKILKESNVVISDLTSLVESREKGLYTPDREKDVLLQDEQDESLFNNLWNVEIKGDAYEKETHDLRIEVRREAAKAVTKLGDALKGDKISQSVNINGKAPEFEVNGNKIKIVGTDVEIEMVSGIDEMDMQGFLLDAMLANKVFNEAGKDYVVIDGEVKPISPSTGSKEDIPEGVLQAIAINENISEIQPEYEVKKVVSKLSILKECFSEVSGMSATYGQLGTKITKEFFEVLSAVNISPDLIPVLEIFKEEGSIPNFENIKKAPKNNKEEGKNLKEKVMLTIDGKKVEKELPPHIAAIVRDIEAHKDEAIIIATDNREKTLEITKALQEAYEHKQAPIYKKDEKTKEKIFLGYEDAIKGYSGVPQENGDPKLYAPPNPAEDEKLNITPPRIVIGDHSIGRGVTPFDEKDFYENEIKGEHLIVAQMPSRSESLLEQFLGRVGRKKINGSVSFVLGEKDKIIKEFFEKKGKNPEKASEIIEEIYPEKTKEALKSTKADIDISRALASEKYQAMTLIIAAALSQKTNILEIDDKYLREARKITEDPEILKSFLEGNPKAASMVELTSKIFDKKASLCYKQYKSDFETFNAEKDYLDSEVVTMILEKNKEAKEKTNKSKQKEIAEATVDSRYSKIVEMITRAKELSEIHSDKSNQKLTDDRDEK